MNIYQIHTLEGELFLEAYGADNVWQVILELDLPNGCRIEYVETI